MKKILFPTDFSEAAKNGFRYAVALAEDIDAELDIMNVFAVPFTAPDEMPPNYVDQLIDNQKKIAKEKLDAFVESVAPKFKGKKMLLKVRKIPYLKKRFSALDMNKIWRRFGLSRANGYVGGHART